MAKRGSWVAWCGVVLGALALAAASPVACSAGGSGDDDDGSGLSGSGGGFGGNLLTGGSGGGEACVAQTFPGELAPLDLYIMLDRSGSMSDENKWSNVTSALVQFVQSSEVDGIGVGLHFFPQPPTEPHPVACSQVPDDPICGIYGPCWDLGCPLQPGVTCCEGNIYQDASCVTDDYMTPTAGIAELPGAASGLVSAINGESSGGGATPTLFALEAAVSYTSDWAQANPTHIVYIVLATDGMPEGCKGTDPNNPVNTVQAVADIASQAAGGSPAVQTFVIGVGDQLSDLNQVAQAGGTGQAFIVDVGSATQQFIDALNEIRELGVCTFQIPQPTGGEELDFERVNVRLIDPDDPSNNTTVPYVGNLAACDPTGGGWYYDNTGAPTKIILCPATCDTVRSTDWDISVELGCRTVTR